MDSHWQACALSVGEVGSPIPSCPTIDQSGSRRWPNALIALVLIMALYDVIYFTVYFFHSFSRSDLLFGDFAAFYAFAKFAIQGSTGNIYDVATLQAFEHNLPNAIDGFYPYPYPPIFLLYLWPLGWFSYLAAYCIWISMTLGAYLVAVAGRDWRLPQLWVALCAPTTLLGIIAGQNGFLTGALLVGGFRLMSSSPVVAGAILGGLAFKPQLFILVPIVLLAAGQMRALAGMTLSILGMALFSIAVFGWRMWMNWFVAMPNLLKVFAANGTALYHLMPTVTASLLEAGFSPSVAEIFQGASTLCTIAMLCVLFARSAWVDGAVRKMDAAALQVAAFLVTPYGFVYDMPMVTASVITTVEDRFQTGKSWRSGEIPVQLAAFFLPLIVASGTFNGLLAGPLVLWAAFLIIFRAAWFRPLSTSMTRRSARGWPA